mmetsp:Transcript_36274/g.78272  ORF Transcript_36274/g.78272 Transcript_36274/m.78272 type:complete len:301 (-) Transcript_36274:91-993(-)
MISSNRPDIIDCITAMRVRDETIPKCINYFNLTANNNATREEGGIDETCRTAMVTWITQVQKTLSLNPETVWIAMSFFDRYLSSSRGESQKALGSKREFQLAAITSYYTAVKIYEPVMLGIDTLMEICHDTYSKYDIVSMEHDILSALDWRVACHTPMGFVRHLLELLPKLSSHDSNTIIQVCQNLIDEYAIKDIYFSPFAPSVVGISCLAISLAIIDTLSLSKAEGIWYQLSESCEDFELSSKEVMSVQQRLLSRVTPTTRNKSNSFKFRGTVSKSAVVNNVDGGSLSPICVTQTARQA